MGRCAMLSRRSRAVPVRATRGKSV
jgi:hypothetical protein